MTSKEKIKYYIIKDLDTGLYYRGKGQNRWGKYYNQASIFRNLAQAHNSVEELKRYYKSNAVAIEIEINEQTNTSFEECIKEWEENYGVLQNDEYYLEVIDEWNVRILIDKKTKRYQCYSVSDDIRRLETPMFVEIDAHHLLSKTIKALENNNETK